jgi:hypothetical protein
VGICRFSLYHTFIIFYAGAIMLIAPKYSDSIEERLNQQRKQKGEDYEHLVEANCHFYLDLPASRLRAKTYLVFAAAHRQLSRGPNKTRAVVA